MPSENMLAQFTFYKGLQCRNYLRPLPRMSRFPASLLKNTHIWFRKQACYITLTVAARNYCTRARGIELFSGLVVVPEAGTKAASHS